MSQAAWRKTIGLLGELMRYTAPRGNRRIRLRIAAAFGCLVASKGANMLTPLLYGAAVDLVNGSSGFAMKALVFLVGGYALARLGQQIFAEAKQYLFAKVAQRAVRGAAMRASVLGVERAFARYPILHVSRRVLRQCFGTVQSVLVRALRKHSRS